MSLVSHAVKECVLGGGQTNLKVTPNHHLQHQKQLSVRNVPVSVHIVNLERDWVWPSVNRGS